MFALNHQRWLIVGYLLALMWLSASILLLPGEKYDTLTTSDSGWVYNCAVLIENTSALAENNPWSHAPYGFSFLLTEQMQPLFAVIIYRGLHTIAPTVTLMDVSRIYSPLLFSLSLIPVFLIAREFKGNLAGCISAFLMATMVPTIYWHKYAAFDREGTILLLSAWTLFFFIKVFKADRKSVPIWAVLGGLTLALLLLSWDGAKYVLVVGMAGLLLIISAAFVGRLVHKFLDIFGAVFFAIRTHLPIIAGVLGMFLIATIVLWVVGISPIFWIGLFQMLMGYAGIPGGGGAGPSFPRYASEMRAPDSFWQVWEKSYGEPGPGNILSILVMFMIAIAFISFLWKRRPAGFLILAWFFILSMMVLPGKGQARFERVWWLFYPVVGGIGIATLLSWLKNLSFDPSWEWLKKFQSPVLLGILAVFLGSAFVMNAYANASIVSPPTNWHTYVSDYSSLGATLYYVPLDDVFMEVFEWVKENTPENAIFSIQWSYGHVFSGATQRATVVDGCETMAEEGKWEDTSYIPRPPDYIYYVEDGRGHIYGINAGVKPYTINGRRVDVARFARVGEDELKWYLKEYRDTYGTKIDYIIFSYDEYSVAKYAYVTQDPTNILLDPAIQIEPPSRLSPSVEENQRYLFDFGGDRDAVVLDLQNRRAYLREDGVEREFDGYALFGVNEDQEITHYYGFHPPRTAPAIDETLLVLQDPNRTFVGAGLVQGVSEKIMGRPTPIAVLAFDGGLDEVDYLQDTPASTGLVKLLKVDHSVIT